MPHIEEGMLHEYLDRGGDREPELQYVTDHITGCASCWARLQEAESLRAASHAILRAASPAGLVAPSFESVLARSAQTSSPEAAVRPARRGYAVPRFAWAATVVLALGAGWMANSLYRSGALDERGEATTISDDGTVTPVEPNASGDAVQSSPDPDAPVASPAAPEADARTRAAAPAGTTGGVTGAGAQSPGSAGADAPPTGGGSLSSAGAAANQASAASEGRAPVEANRRALAETPPAEKARAPQPTVGAATQDAARQEAARTRESASAQVSPRSIPPTSVAPSPSPPPPPAAPPPQAPIPSAVQERPVTPSDFSATGVAGGRADGDTGSVAGRLLQPGVWRISAQRDAGAVLGGGVVVAAGLGMIDIAVASGDGAQRVRVRQRMPAGDTVQIIQQRDTATARAGTASTFTVLARGQHDASMYQLLSHGQRTIVVVGRTAASVQRAVSLLRMQPQQ